MPTGGTQWRFAGRQGNANRRTSVRQTVAGLQDGGF